MSVGLAAPVLFHAACPTADGVSVCLCALCLQMEDQLEMMDQLEMLEEKLTTRSITRGKSLPLNRERMPAYLSRAATNAIALELAEAHELLRDPQESHSNCGALPPPRKGPTTPPLLQRPLAVDSDEESIWRGRSTQADVLSAPRLRKRGKSVGKRKRGSAEVVNEHGAHTKRSPSARQRTDSAEIRKDALERSVEAIESLSLALDYVNEEKKVLLRVLEACETSGFAVNKALHSETLDGSSRLAQASFIAQMLPGVDSKVVERMSAKAIKAMQSVLQLKLAHAQATAKIVELELQKRPTIVSKETYSGRQSLELQGHQSAGVSSPLTHEPTVQRLRADLDQIRAENEQLRVNLLAATQELLLRGTGAGKKGDSSLKGDSSALVIS